jgi:hypothetical protein
MLHPTSKSKNLGQGDNIFNKIFRLNLLLKNKYGFWVKNLSIRSAKIISEIGGRKIVDPVGQNEESKLL